MPKTIKVKYLDAIPDSKAQACLCDNADTPEHTQYEHKIWSEVLSLDYLDDRVGPAVYGALMYDTCIMWLMLLGNDRCKGIYKKLSVVDKKIAGKSHPRDMYQYDIYREV